MDKCEIRIYTSCPLQDGYGIFISAFEIKDPTKISRIVKVIGIEFDRSLIAQQPYAVKKPPLKKNVYIALKVN